MAASFDTKTIDHKDHKTFSSQTVSDAKQVLDLFKQNRVFVKVMKAAFDEKLQGFDNTSLNFLLDQLADPKNTRPVNPHIKPNANRNKVLNLVTRKWEQRVASEYRGEPKDTRFMKKTSLSKPPTDGIMLPFKADTYVGFIFEHDDYNHKDHKVDTLVKLSRDKETGLPKYCFAENGFTDNRFWIENQPDSKNPTYSVTLGELEERNKQARDHKQIPKHNEVLGSPSKESVRAVYANKLFHRGQPLIAPKLNAIRVKYLVQDRLGLSVPVMFMTPETGICEYKEEGQLTDLIAGLNSPHDTLRFHFAHQILDRCFLENDNLWRTVITANISSQTKYLPEKLRLLDAMTKAIGGQYDPLIKEFATLREKDEDAYFQAVEIFFELIQKEKVNANEILGKFFNKNIPILAIVNLCIERHFQAIEHSLEFILNHLNAENGDIEDLYKHLICYQQYDLAFKVASFKPIKLKDGNNALYDIFLVSENSNLKPPTKLIAKLTESNSVAEENKNEETPLLLAASERDYANVEYFLINHFNQFQPDKLVYAFYILMELKHFRLLNIGLAKLDEKDEQKNNESSTLLSRFKNLFKETLSLKLAAQNSLLHQAILQTSPDKKADLDTIKRIIKLNPWALTQQNSANEFPLVTACRIGRWDLVEYLINDQMHQSSEKIALNIALPYFREHKKYFLIKDFLKRGHRFYGLQALDSMMMLLAEDQKETVQDRMQQMHLVYQWPGEEKDPAHLNMRYLTKVIDHFSLPQNILELMNAVNQNEMKEPKMTKRFSFTPTLNYWNKTPAPTHWVNLINHAKAKILKHAEMNTAQYDAKLTADISLFLGQPTRTGFFSVEIPPEKEKFELMLKKAVPKQSLGTALQQPTNKEA